MEHREFVYIGEDIPKITENAHAEFLLNYQKSILLALAKRNLITLQQVELCMEKIIEQQCK